MQLYWKYVNLDLVIIKFEYLFISIFFGLMQKVVNIIIRQKFKKIGDEERKYKYIVVDIVFYIINIVLLLRCKDY